MSCGITPGPDALRTGSILVLQPFVWDGLGEHSSVERVQLHPR